MSYTYNLRGNLIGQQDVSEYQWWWDYYWSAGDNLIKAEYSTEQRGVVKTVEYKYDLLGRRIATRVTPPYGTPGPWRWFFYDGLKMVAEGSGTSDKSYYTLSPGAIGGIISRDNNGTKLWYHFDRLGNVMAVTDSNGRAYAVYTMEAFGNLLQVGTSNGYGYYSSQSDPQPYHLTTKEYDPDTQLYYFNERWYDGGTGIFVSRDSEDHGSRSGYVFCRQNPVTLFDADGKAASRSPGRPIWPKACAQQIYKEVNPKYGGSFGKMNAMRHCVASCKAARECLGGCYIASWAGWWYEHKNGWTGDWETDMGNNRKGLYCAACPADYWAHVEVRFIDRVVYKTYDIPDWVADGANKLDCDCCCDKVASNEKVEDR